MGKGDKRRKKKSLPKLAATPKRKNRGWARMRDIQIAEEQVARDPTITHTVLDARARLLGKDPAKHRDEMRSPIASDEAGRAIMSALRGDHQKKAWGAYTGLISARDRFYRSIGKSPYPKTGNIETAPERFETRADDRPDLRTQEQKDVAAEAAWMRWQGYVMRLSIAEQTAIWDHVTRGVIVHENALTTWRGRLFAEALLKLAEVSE